MGGVNALTLPLPRMQLSINQLADLTGKDRRTITQRLADLHHVDGSKGAYLYESDEALAMIYQSANARDELDKRRCEDIALNMEIKRKQRIPMDIVAAIWDAALQAFAATLKAARGTKLDAKKINELLAKLRSTKLPLQW